MNELFKQLQYDNYIIHNIIGLSTGNMSNDFWRYNLLKHYKQTSSNSQITVSDVKETMG